MLGHEQEKCQSITVMRGQVVNSTKLTDEQKKEYFECIKSVEGNMDIMKSRQFHPEMTSKTVGRTIMGVVPEGLVSLGMSIATMNPLSIVVSTASLALAGKSEYEFNKEFTHRKTQLLNSMDNTRVFLNIDEYSKGKGIDVLKEREFYRGVEVKAFEKFRDYLNVYIEKGEPLPKGAREQYDVIYKDEVAKAQSQFPKHETFGDKAKDYFSSMKDVIIKGFSVNQTKAMYNPFAKRGENPESLQGKIDELRSASIKLEKELGSKSKVEQPSKQQFTDMVSRPKQTSTQIGA
jgi:hypothetical protein